MLAVPRWFFRKLWGLPILRLPWHPVRLLVCCRLSFFYSRPSFLLYAYKCTIFQLNKQIFCDFVSVLGTISLPYLARFCFRTWHDFTSVLGAISLPYLARFHFRTWHDFTSVLGAISLPYLARFHFRTWHIFAPSLISHAGHCVTIGWV